MSASTVEQDTQGRIRGHQLQLEGILSLVEQDVGVLGNDMLFVFTFGDVVIIKTIPSYEYN